MMSECDRIVSWFDTNKEKMTSDIHRRKREREEVIETVYPHCCIFSIKPGTKWLSNATTTSTTTASTTASTTTSTTASTTTTTSTTISTTTASTTISTTTASTTTTTASTTTSTTTIASNWNQNNQCYPHGVVLDTLCNLGKLPRRQRQ